MSDLAGHATDFSDRTGFTYSVLDGDEVIGCVYIYPSNKPGCDAGVSSWVRQSSAELDVGVWAAVSDWLETTWPFGHPFYATRETG